MGFEMENTSQNIIGNYYAPNCAPKKKIPVNITFTGILAEKEELTEFQKTSYTKGLGSPIKSLTPNLTPLTYFNKNETLIIVISRQIIHLLFQIFQANLVCDKNPLIWKTK